MSSSTSSMQPHSLTVTPRTRIISDNDYGGDPDGLVQLAQLVLSPSADVRGIIVSHLSPDDSFWLNGEVDGAVGRGQVLAGEVLDLCQRRDLDIVAGHTLPLTSRVDPVESAGARRIIDEAMRDDPLPLFVTCGGSLTEIASAWLIEPTIAERLTVVWIGGPEYPDLAETAPGAPDMEYNCAIDPIAAQVVFNESNLRLWQVPRSTYRMALVSMHELAQRMRPAGALGLYLYDALAAVVRRAADQGILLGETYVLGDNPLVLLTNLLTAFEPGPASSAWVNRACPLIADSGRYVERRDGRPIRVFTAIDNRLMFEDLYAKLAALA